MFNKDEYTKNIFEKYKNINIDDSFYKIKFQKFKKTIFLKNFIFIGISLLCFTSAFAFAENIRNEILDSQNVASVEDVIIYENIEKYMVRYDKNSYYQEIITYDDYITAKSNYGEILSMNEEDFEKYFVVLIANLGEGLAGLYVSDIQNENNNLIISLDRKTDYEVYNRLISVKIDKEMYSENIKISIHTSNTNEDKYSDISSFPIGYTKEDAIKDGYIVIYNENIISENSNAIEEFIEQSSNGIESNIRIIEFNDLFADCDYGISDIVFRNGMYELCQMEIGENAYFKYPRLFKCQYMIRREWDSKFLYTIEDNDGYNNKAYNICSRYK